MFIYVITRAFYHGKTLCSKDQQIDEKLYNDLGENQAFVKKIFSGTQAELDALLHKAIQFEDDKKAKAEPEEDYSIPETSKDSNQESTEDDKKIKPKK